MTKYIITNENITLYYQKSIYTLNKNSSNYNKVIKYLLSGDYKPAIFLMNIKQGIEYALTSYKFDNSNFKFVNGVIYWKNKALNNYVANKIVMLIEKNRNPNLLVAFLDKLMLNPNTRVQDELLQFLEYGKLPICTDGDFLAYKRVDENYHDYHSGKFDYTPGKTNKMKRENCDDNSNNTCSTGLHFCSFNYLSDYYNEEKSKTIIVKINLKNVVSIPNDYEHTKGRACEIYSVCDYEKEHDIDYLKTLDFVKVNKKKKTYNSIRSKKQIVYNYNEKNWNKKNKVSVYCPFCNTLIKGSKSTFESGHGKVCFECGAKLSRRKAYKKI